MPAWVAVVTTKRGEVDALFAGTSPESVLAQCRDSYGPDEIKLDAVEEWFAEYSDYVLHPPMLREDLEYVPPAKRREIPVAANKEPMW